MPRLFEQPDSMPGLTWPTLTFSDRLTIDLGGDRGDLVLQYCGRGHTEGDLVAWLPRQRDPLRGRSRGVAAALYTGDAFHRDWVTATLDAVAALGRDDAGRRPGRGRPRRRGRSRPRSRRPGEFLDVLLAEVGAVRERGGTLKEAFEAAPRGAGADGTAAGRSSSTACRSTCRACGTSWPASSARSSGPRSATARSGTSCRAEPSMGDSPGRWSSATGRSGRRPRCCWRAGACRSSCSTSGRDATRRLQGDLPAARRPRHLGRGRRRRRDRRRGLTWTTARTFHRDRELFSYDVRRRGALALPAVRQHLAVAHRGGARRGDRRRSRSSTCGGATGSSACDQDGGGVTRAAATDGDAVARRSHVVACAGAPRRRGARRRWASRFDGQSFDDRFLICDIRADLPGWATERRFYFDPEWNPGRQVLIHPCPGSRFRIDWQVPADYDLDAEEASGALDAAHPRDRRRPRLRDRLDVGLPVRLALRGPVARRAGAAGRRLRPPVLAVRRARAELRRARTRRTRRGRSRGSATAGRRRRCWRATTPSATRRRWRTSR